MQSLEESESESESESEPPRETSSFPSKDLPHDVVLKILTRLPVKSLIRFRCVCKAWYFSISNSNFISNHLNQAKSYNNNYLLYMKINVDHKQYPEYLLCTAICNSDATLSSISRFVIPFITFRIVGYCNGLICGTVCYGRTIYLWNPSIGKCKTLTGTSLPVKAADTFKSALGFAYHSESDDYKIVRIVGWLKQNVITR
jgi:hypothetical protein